MRSFILLTLMCFFQFFLLGQSTSQIYGDKNHSAEVCLQMQKDLKSFTTNQEATQAINKILKPLGLKPNFIAVPCSNIDNCAAITWSDGLRYIVYDRAFMKSISTSANTNWTNLSIFAHEIGHHLNGHTLHNTNLSDSRAEELEADEFSGFILAKLGATLYQAQAAMKTLQHPNCIEEIHSSHPCLEKRLTAIAKGWNDGHSEVFPSNPTPQNDNSKISSPQLLSPPDNYEFNTYPRKVLLKWQDMKGANSYNIEIEYFVPESNEWINLNQNFLRTRNVKYFNDIIYGQTYLNFEGVGAQAHRWRVKAIGANGQQSEFSEWRTIKFLN